VSLAVLSVQVLSVQVLSVRVLSDQVLHFSDSADADLESVCVDVQIRVRTASRIQVLLDWPGLHAG
jgi:hypothetical protein